MGSGREEGSGEVSAVVMSYMNCTILAKHDKVM